jgi:hypothetical protein
MPVSFLIDTGSTISIIGKEVWDELLAHSKNIRLEKTRKKAYTANNQPLTLMGATEVDVKTGDQTKSQRFIVVQDASQCILGMDYLQKYTSSLNFSSQTLQNTDGKPQKLLSTQEVKPMIKVINCERVVIKPRHEIVVKAQIDGELNGDIIIEPRKELMEKTGLLVARVVVCVQIVNTTNKTITVYKGQTLGEVQELESIEDVKQKQVQGERVNHISRDNVPVDEYVLPFLRFYAICEWRTIYTLFRINYIFIQTA